MAYGHDNLSSGGRRRSASESDGDVMNSLLNPSQPRQMDRFHDRNNEILNSTPHLNVSGFIDDSYRDNLGTRLTRAHTNLRGASKPDEMFRRDYYYRIKDNINEWVAIVFNSSLAMKFIEKYDGICGEIIQCKTLLLIMGISLCFLI